MIKKEQTACCQNIGVAGCGDMGLPMLETLLSNNLKVQGYDVRNKEDFPSVQSHFLESKRQFINNNNIILSVVRDEEETLELCEGKDGLFSNKSKKLILICSTLSPRFIITLKKKAPKNIEFLDTPMSGASIAAKEGRLTFMVGGTKKQFAYISPLLFLMSQNIFHSGKFGSGMAIKVLNNFVTASTVVSVRHVIHQANRMNINVESLLETMDCSSGQTWFGSNRSRIEWFDETYNKDNTIGIIEKDVRAYADVFENSADGVFRGSQELCNAVLAGLRHIPQSRK